MLPITLCLALSLGQAEAPEPLGEFRQGLYWGRMIHGATLRLRLEDDDDRRGRVWGTLAGFDPGGPIRVSGELTGTKITLTERPDGREPALLAEGSMVAEAESEGRYVQFELRFVRRPPMPPGEPGKVGAWMAQLDHEDPDLRQEAARALGRVGAEGLLRRALEESGSSEVRARLSEILEERVLFRQLSRDLTTEMVLNRTIRSRCRFPSIRSGPVPLRKSMMDLKGEAFERSRAEARGFAKELEDEDVGSRVRSYEEDWDVRFASGPLVSVSALVTSYGGGAHENYQWRTGTLWLDGQVARPVRLSELFRPCSYWESRLSDRVVASLRRSGASSVVDGVVSELGEGDLGCWVLTPTGIEFLFAPYVLGCFAEGSYAAEVAYSELLDILADQGPASEVRRHLP